MPGIELLLACALHVAPQTAAAVIEVESRGSPLAVHVNGVDIAYQPATVAEAVAVARTAIAAGHSVDLGLMQVNSRNLDRLGYSLEQMFEPCTNIKAGSSILQADYIAAVRTYGEGQAALRAALSAYNSGDFERGFRNGYVARYYRLPQAQSNIAVRSVAKAPTVSPYLAEMTVFTRKVSDEKIH